MCVRVGKHPFPRVIIKGENNAQVEGMASRVAAGIRYKTLIKKKEE